MELKENNQIKHQKLNMISKIKHDFIQNIFIYQNNILVFKNSFILYNVNTLEIISTFKIPNDMINIKKIEITPQNEILILSDYNFSSWKLNIKENKMENIFTIQKVYSFIQNKPKNEILINTIQFFKIDYSGKIIYYQKNKPIIEYEYKIMPIKKYNDYNFNENYDDDNFNNDNDYNFNESYDDDNFNDDNDYNSNESDDYDNFESNIDDIMIMEIFNNNKNFFYFNGNRYSSGDPHEPWEYEEYFLSIYDYDNLTNIYGERFYYADLKKLTEKYLYDGNVIYYFDFDKKELIKNNKFMNKIQQFYYFNEESFMCLTFSNSLLIVDSLKWEIKEIIDCKLNKNEYFESLLIIDNDNDKNKNNKFICHIHSTKTYFSYLLIGESY